MTDEDPSAPLSDAQRSALRARLGDERALVSARIEQLTGDFDAIVESAALDVPDDEHDPEGATLGFERAQVAAMVEQARADLAALDRALVAIGDPAFGMCTGCGRPVGFERLRARPGTSVCVACAAAAGGSRTRR